MSLSNDVIAKKWMFWNQINQSWSFHAKSIELKQKQKREIIDKIKRKKKKKKKSTSRYSSKHKSTHVFNWTRHRTRKQTNLIDWQNRDSSIDDRLQISMKHLMKYLTKLLIFDDINSDWISFLNNKRKEKLMLSFDAVLRRKHEYFRWWCCCIHVLRRCLN
jgi:hypothetical protein